MIQIVTDLGDAALLVPASLAIFAMLYWARAHRTAYAWGLSIGLCLVLIGALKMYFHACGAEEAAAFDIRSPSGHTAFSMTIYGCLFLMCGAEQSSKLRLTWQMLLILLIPLIAASRVMIGSHSIAEVVVGAGVGAMSMACFWLLARRLPDASAPVPAIIGTLVLLAVLTHGLHLDAEQLIQLVADRIAHRTGLCAAGIA
jgi:membrane-associated phospholipid phosphatase